MDIHHNAALTPRGRGRLVRRVLQDGWSQRTVAKYAGVDPKTVGRWVARYQAEGDRGLYDRSARPRRQPRPRQNAST